MMYIAICDICEWVGVGVNETWIIKFDENTNNINLIILVKVNELLKKSTYCNNIDDNNNTNVLLWIHRVFLCDYKELKKKRFKFLKLLARVWWRNNQTLSLYVVVERICKALFFNFLWRKVLKMRAVVLFELWLSTINGAYIIV